MRTKITPPHSMTIIFVIISLVVSSSCQREPLDQVSLDGSGAFKPVEITFYTHVGEDPLTKAHSIQEDNILRIVPEEPQGEFGILRERKTGERNALLYKSSVDFEDIEGAPTKATASEVVSVSSFNLVCVTGSAGSESQQWSLSNTGASTGKYWPASDQGYKFYASNVPLTFNSAGCTIAATNTTDVVVCYKDNPVYGAGNSLQFNHIFGRIGDVTVNPDEGFSNSDITDVSVTITPKTGGTYNVRTGEWSSVTTGSATSIANSTPGIKDNGLYLVPGTYSVSATWKCKGSDFDGSGEVTVTAGQQLNLTITLGGQSLIVVDAIVPSSNLIPSNMLWSGILPTASSIPSTIGSSVYVSLTVRITDGNNVSTYTISSLLANALMALGSTQVQLRFSIRVYEGSLVNDLVNYEAYTGSSFDSDFYFSDLPGYDKMYGFYGSVSIPSTTYYCVSSYIYISISGITLGKYDNSGNIVEWSGAQMFYGHPENQPDGCGRKSWYGKH